MTWKTLDDVDIHGKDVLVRVDINVPVANGEVVDITRLDRIAPTILEILDKGGKPILLSHFGRPTRGFDLALSNQQVVAALAKVLGRRVHFATSCIGEVARQAVDTLPTGDVLLLENTRFHAGEVKNDPDFAAELAKLGDVFCSDTFSTSHRAHASVEAIARLLPSFAGRLMQEELDALQGALGNPKRPLAAVVGGSKVSSKLLLLRNLVVPVDRLIIGGGMANTFLAAKGYEIGQSLSERELVDTAREIMLLASENNCELILPVDVVVAREFRPWPDHETVAAGCCPADAMILDAGPRSVELICAAFEKSKTLIWNGPLGAFEIPPFNVATDACAQKAAELTRQGSLLSVAGGGDTVAALKGSDSADAFSYISTAGGAFLEWMEGRDLPGVTVLQK